MKIVGAIRRERADVCRPQARHSPARGCDEPWALRTGIKSSGSRVFGASAAHYMRILSGSHAGRAFFPNVFAAVLVWSFGVVCGSQRAVVFEHGEDLHVE